MAARRQARHEARQRARPHTDNDWRGPKVDSAAKRDDHLNYNGKKFYQFGCVQEQGDAWFFFN